MLTAMQDWKLVRWLGQPAGLLCGALRNATRSESNSRCRESQFLRRRAYGIFVWAPLARESLGSGGLSMNRTPSSSSHPSPPGYLVSEMGTPQRDRGRESSFTAPPPSKPDRRISRIRLSSQWGLGETNHRYK